jgi:hypothetical protein
MTRVWGRHVVGELLETGANQGVVSLRDAREPLAPLNDLLVLDLSCQYALVESRVSVVTSKAVLDA